MTKKMFLPGEVNPERLAAPQEFVKAIVAPERWRYPAAAPLHIVPVQLHNLERRPGVAEAPRRDLFSRSSSWLGVHEVQDCPGTTEPLFARQLPPLLPGLPANRGRPGAGKRCTHRLAG